MNSGTITNQLLDAVQVLVDDAVKKAEFDRTVQAVISKCVSTTKGQYSVKYQGGFFYAYAQDPSITYTPETQVYVLIPGNDMNKTKTILGTVEKLGENFISEAESSIFENVGNNICSDIEGTVYGLHSYYITDNIVLYERGTTPTTDFAINEDAANLYLKNSDYLMIAAKFRTNLPQEHRTKGNYGLKYTLTFIDPITGENIDRSYTLDINNMLGNPYAQAVSMRQVLPFEIDADNFQYIKKIEIFSKDFTTVADPSKPADIFISDIELNGALMIPVDEGTGYILSLITKQGIYFKENDSLSSTRRIEAELYKNGEKQVITDNDVVYYWFKEDGSIYYNSPGFLKYGGQGWRCLNEETLDGKFLPGQSYIDVSKLNNPAKENNYKCVVVFKNTTLYMDREIIIYNQSSNYTVTLNSDVSNLSDAAIAHLTCEVTGTLPGHTITYSWSKVVDNRLPAEFISESNSSTLEVDLREAIKNVVYKCTAKDSTDNIYLGSDSVAITRGSEETAGYYYISMINDNQIFKYDTHGDSPTNISLINPQIINPLSFTLYDPDGQVVSYEDIGASNINWIIPDEETSMIIDAEPMSTYNEKLGFDIKGKYNINAINNTIEVEVFYDNKTIRGKANLIFLKEGENGSNGTSYYLNVVPNYSGDNAPNGRVFYYYRDVNNQGFNFTPIANKFPFRTLFYRDGDIIYDSNRDQDNVQVIITYDFVKRIYFTDKTHTPYVTYSDDSRFEINGNNIDCIDVALGDQAGEYSADILRCTFEYEGLVWYYYYPIIFVKYDANASNCEIVIPETSGFTEVIYTEDGRNPQYKGSNVFDIDVYRNYEKISSEVDWEVQGQIYTSEWQEEANLIAKNENEFNAKEAYNGNCVTNALYGEVSDGTNSIAEIHFPITMYLNTYANEFINEWNGNAIELNEEGGIILTPQIAAGQKENDNTFTGVVGGKAKEATSDTIDEGIFGYNHGERTFELSAEDGSAKFGKAGEGQIIISPDEDGAHSVLRSGGFQMIYSKASGFYNSLEVYFRKDGDNYIELKEGVDYQEGDPITGNNIYYWSSGQGLEIDLTDPHIRFGKNTFRVESNGNVYASQFVAVDRLENGEYDIPSASVQVNSSTTLADYVSTTNTTLGDLQDQIDGNISTWFYDYVPTLSNAPANEWTTTTEKDNHLGDLFYNTTTGYCYRFMKTNNTYSWGQLSDSDIAEALAAAQAAQDTADHKRRVFVSTPEPPYDIGDLWVEGSSGDIKKCKTAKTSSQSYSASDWEKASKYTDDTTVNNLKPSLVTSTIVEYALGTSSSTAPETGWDQVAPEWESGKYMWQRTTTIYADDTQQNPHRVTSDPTCLTGATGATGAAGTSVSSITAQYYLSTSKEEPTGSSWVEVSPTWQAGMYIWTRSKIIYSNPSSTEYTTPLCSSEWEAVNNIRNGGRNYIINSTKIEFMSQTEAYKDGESGPATQDGSKPGYFEFSEDFIPEDFAGTEMTLSFDCKILNPARKSSATEDPTCGMFIVFETGNTEQRIEKEIEVLETTSVNTRYGLTFTVPSNWTNTNISSGIVKAGFFMYNHAETCTIDLDRALLTTGNQIEDWSASPEEINKELENARTLAGTAQSTADSAYQTSTANQADIIRIIGEDGNSGYIGELQTANEGLSNQVKITEGKTPRRVYQQYQRIKAEYQPYENSNNTDIFNSDLVYYNIDSTTQDYYIFRPPLKGNLIQGSYYLRKPTQDLETHLVSTLWQENRPSWQEGYFIYSRTATEYEGRIAGTGDSDELQEYVLPTESKYLADVTYYEEQEGEYYELTPGEDYTIGSTIDSGVYVLRVYSILYSSPTLCEDGLTIEEKTYIDASKVLNLMRGESFVFYRPGELLVYDQPTETQAYKSIKMNSAGISFGTRSDLNENFTWNSVWKIDGTFDAQNINVINLSARSIIDGKLTLGNESDGELIIEDDQGNIKAEFSSQRLIIHLDNQKYVIIGKDVGLQVIGANNQVLFGNQLKWTPIVGDVGNQGVTDPKKYENNVNYYREQGNFDWRIINSQNQEEGSLYREEDLEKLTNYPIIENGKTVYTISCLENFVVGTAINFGPIQTVTFDTTSHKGIGFIKGGGI